MSTTILTICYFQLAQDIVPMSYNLWADGGALPYMSWNSAGRLVNLIFSVATAIWFFINVKRAWFSQGDSSGSLRSVLMGTLVLFLLWNASMMMT